MTFKEFEEIHNGGYKRIASEDIQGFYKKGSSIYGNADDLIVDYWLYQPLNGIYTVWLSNPLTSQ